MKKFLVITTTVFLILDVVTALVQENKAPIFATMQENRAFFHLFKVQYIVCFFASKGKWPFIPPFQQVKVDSVSRSLFPQSDSFIQRYCKNWVPVSKCYRPQQFTQYNVQPAYQPLYQPAVEIAAVVTYQPEPVAEPICSCTPSKQPEPESESEIIYFDKNHIGNISTETILNTIEFLESFVQQMMATTTQKPIKRKTKNRLGK